MIIMGSLHTRISDAFCNCMNKCNLLVRDAGGLKCFYYSSRARGRPAALCPLSVSPAVGRGRATSPSGGVSVSCMYTYTVRYRQRNALLAPVLTRNGTISNLAALDVSIPTFDYSRIDYISPPFSD